MVLIKTELERDVKVLLKRRAERHGHTFDEQVAFTLEGFDLDDAMMKKKLEKYSFREKAGFFVPEGLI